MHNFILLHFQIPTRVHIPHLPRNVHRKKSDTKYILLNISETASVVRLLKF